VSVFFQEKLTFLIVVANLTDGYGVSSAVVNIEAHQRRFAAPVEIVGGQHVWCLW
jgi:hypothetical protein